MSNNCRRMERRDILKLAGGCSLASLVAADSAQAQAIQPSPRDTPHSLALTGADLGTRFTDVHKLAQLHEFEYSFLGSRFESLEEFKTVSREKLLECFGRRPAKTAADPEVVDRRDFGDFVREKIIFSTTPTFRVPAYLHIPKSAVNRPAPAIVDLHSHGGMFLFGKEKVIDLGTNHPVMQSYHKKVYGSRPTSTALVRRGYVVITIDTFMFGERRVMIDEDLEYGWERSRYTLEDAQHLNAVCRSKESTIVKALALAGYTWPGVVTWDDMRTVDYLITRPEVDSSRIGCLGVSMGGHRTLYLAGLDERLAAACVVGFMSTVKPMIKSHIDTHSFVHFVPLLHQYLDMPDVVSMMAPKPLMIQQCRQDALYPPRGMSESVNNVAAVYDKAGVPDRFVGRFYDGRHRFDQPMQNDAFEWLDRQLKA